MTRRLALLLALLLPLAALPVARSAAAEAIAAAGDEGLEWRRSGHGAGAFRFEFDWEHSWFSYEKSSKVAKPKADAKGKAPPSSSEESGGAETVTTIHRTVTTVHSKLKACHTEGLVLFGGRNKLSEGVAENATDVDFAYFNTVRVALRNDGSCGQKATPLLSYKPVQARSVARAAGRHVKFLSGGKGVPAPRESFSLHPLDWNLFADIRPVAECIREAPTESKSGLKLNFIRAQFGYENFFPETLTLPKGPANALYQTKLVDMHEYLTAVVGTNDLIDKEARYPNNFTTKFEPGVAEKQFFVDFDCHQGIVWTIKSPYGVTRKAVASIDSPVCPGAKLSKDSCLWKDVHKRGGEGIVAKSWKDEMQNKKATYEKTVTTVGGEGSEDSEESSLLEVASAPATGKPATNAEAESAEDDFDVHRRVPPQEWNNNNKVQSFLMFGGYGGYADRTFFNDLWLLHILPPPEVNRIVVPNSTFAGWRSWASGDLQHEYEDKGKPQPAKPKASASPSPEAAKDESAGEDEEYKKWQFDVRWEKPRITGARPVGRYRHASVQVGPLFIVHGGFSARHGFFDDTWMLDTRRLFNPSRYVGEAWRDMDVVGDGPPARAGHSAELITMVNQLVYVVFFGGYAKTNVTADVSMLHTGCRQKNATYIDCPANDKLKFYWIRLQEDVPDQLELPGGRYGHQAFRQFDKSPNTILILGGYGYLKRPAWLKLNESEKYEYDFKPPKEKVAERERAKLLPMHIWSLQCGNLHDVPAEMKVVSFDRDDPYLNVYSTCTWARNQKLDLPSRRDYTLTRFDDKLTLALGGVVENPSSAFRAPERSYWEMKKLDDGKVEVIKPKPKPAPPAIVMEVEESFDFKL